MGNTRKVLLSSSKDAGLVQLDEEQSIKLKSLLLEMYKDIFEFCEKNKICVIIENEIAGMRFRGLRKAYLQSI